MGTRATFINQLAFNYKIHNSDIFASMLFLMTDKLSFEIHIYRENKEILLVVHHHQTVRIITYVLYMGQVIKAN